MTAYAYLRKSSVRDPSREVSHQVQEAAVHALAARYGDDDGLVLLSDWDKSGRLGADKRPGYRALLDAIASGRASAVYSYSLSRLARSVPELSRLIADCNDRGIPVRLEADHVDTSTASGKLLTHVLGAVAQFEADVASERVRAANGAKLARGDSLRTVRLYGEAPGDDPAAVLAAFREAGSYSGAARLLNERGVRPRNSRRGWWPSAVAVVVRRLDPTVGARRPTRGYAAGGTDFILARLLRCPTCGTLLTGTRDRGGARVRYACRMGTARPHPRVSITEGHILPAIRAEVDRLRLPERVEAATRDAARVAALEDRRARVLDMYEAGHIDRTERERRLAAIAEELARLDEHRVVLAVPSIDWTWPAKQLNAVLRALFDHIELDPVTFAVLPDQPGRIPPPEYWAPAG
jgi:DNA invertase Pin-like site-specific DNA recombinase